MPTQTKKIRERVTQMNDGWSQGAENTAFSGITQTQFDTRIKAAAAFDREVEEMEAALVLKKQFRDGLYEALNDDSVRIIAAVKIHPDYGDDHPLVDAMGFVRDSERKSGLTRKKEPKPPTS